MLTALALVAGLSLHFGKAPTTQTADSVRQFLVERSLDATHSYQIAPEVLKATVGTGRPFPLVQVFTEDGILIFAEDGYTLGMRRRLEAALRDRKPVAGGVSLAEELEELRTFDGKLVESASLPPAKLVVIDHWAMWCSACKPQMKLLESFASAHKTDGLVLVKVNWDQIAE